MKAVEASYENGLLKPAKPLQLNEGEHVRIIVVRLPDPSRWNLDKIAAVAGQEDALLASAGPAWVSCCPAPSAS
jgi:predicted DNA-binding antitoxin AbrB/MazE fold protein